MRTFIAIETPEKINKILKKIQKEIKSLGKINFTREPYHLTLKFLGNTTEEQISRLKTLLKKVKFKPFELEITKIGAFPNQNYIRVLWIGIKGKAGELQQKIDSKLSELFEKDKKFHAHITLGRVKSVKNKEKIKEILKKKIPYQKFKVKEFKLIKSELTPEGPIYEDVEKYEA